MVKTEGLQGLYKGVVPPIVFQCPIYALLFAGKEFGDRILNRYGDFSADSKSFISGGIGGVISTIISCPAELLKINAQANHTGKTEYIKFAKNLVKTRGVGSFYQGFLCTVIRDIPSYAVYFGVFEIG